MTGLSRSASAETGARHHVICDLGDAGRTTNIIRSLAPDLVVNAQAFSNVDRCEQEPEQARAQNVRTTEHIVQALEGTRAFLVQVSTDYVFDGTKGAPYQELDVPRPVNVYGRSKLEGEQAALRHPRAVVVRTSTLFGADRINFCDQIVTRLRAGQTVEAFTDQVTSPTYTVDLAEGIGDLGTTLSRSRGIPTARLFHITNTGACGRVALAERVADLIGGSRELILKVPMAAQRRPARRPAYSALTTTQLPLVIGRTLRPWDEALHAYLHQRRWLN